MHPVKLLPQQEWGLRRAMALALQFPGSLRTNVRTVQLQVVVGMPDPWKAGFGCRARLRVSWGFMEDGPAREPSSAHASTASADAGSHGGRELRGPLLLIAVRSL